MAQYACDQGYKTAYLLGSPEIPYTKDMPRLLRGRVRADLRRRDRRRGHVQDRPDRVRHAGHEDPEREPCTRRRSSRRSSCRTRERSSSSCAAAGVETPVPDDRRERLEPLSATGRQRGRRVRLLDARLRGRRAASSQTFIEDYTAWKGSPPESNTFEAIGRDNVYAYVAGGGERRLDRAGCAARSRPRS